MRWVKHSEDVLMPNWLKDELGDECPECHSPIYNGYNDDNECTRRKCEDDNCPRTIAAKIAFMCEELKIAGIKSGVGYKLVKDHNLKNHFDAIPYICSEKPRILLSTLVKFAFIFGMGDDCIGICKDDVTIKDVLNRYTGKYENDLRSKEEELRRGEEVFEIIIPVKHETAFPSLLSGCIVVHGEVPGFEDRNTFVPTVNATFMGLTSFSYSKSKRKTGLFCCISNDKTSMSAKVKEAKEAGAPIYDKNELLAVIIDRIKRAGYWDDYQKVFADRSGKD